MSETFEIYVGSPTNPGVCFEVSKILLTKHSGYFAARSRMTRAAPEQRRTIFLHEDLSTDHALVLAIFVEWIETGDILSVRTPFVTVDENDPSIIDDGHERMWMISKKKFYEANVDRTRLGRLLQCWILGDYYLAGAFQNAIMNELIALLHNLDLGKRHGGMPVGKIWDDVFEQTAGHSKLRNFVADALYANMSAQTFREACAVDMFDVEDLRDALLETGLNVRQSMTAGRAPWAYGVDKKIYHVKVVDWHVYYGMYGMVEDRYSKDLRAQVPGCRNVGGSITIR